MEDKRYGFVGILIDQGAASGMSVQPILSAFSPIICGRMGLPHLEGGNLAVITLIVHATTDEIGALTGRLGKLPGVSVKSGLAKLGKDGDR